MEFTTQLLRGIFGVVVLLGFAYAMSADRKRINWRIVMAGVALQFVVVGALKIEWIAEVFGWISGVFVQLLGFTEEGAEFVFGPLSDSKASGNIFAFQVLPSIIFFSALTSLLYYFGILQFVVRIIAWVMSRAMKLSGAESLAAAANIFIGQTEAPLVVKPYIPKMSRSEIMALMTGGMATIAGAVLVAYVGMLGGDSDTERQTFAAFLLTASIMNAPAALYVAKIMVPETGAINRTLAVSKESVGSNALDAVAGGTTQGLKLALNVGAMLIAFIALIAMFDAIVGWVGGIGINEAVASASDGVFEKLSLESICGFIFAPVAWIIGVDADEVLRVGGLLGVKIIATEFIAFLDLAGLKEAGDLSERSIFLATFALCGFANFGSIGIQLGGIGALAPDQRPTLASLALKAMVGGLIASLLSASIAGIFFFG